MRDQDLRNSKLDSVNIELRYNQLSSALLALVQQWREKADGLGREVVADPRMALLGLRITELRDCADQLERLITGEGK